MSEIKSENLLGLVPIDTLLPDPSRARSRAAGARSFDDHLWRVRELSEETTAGGQPDSARLSPPRAAPVGDQGGELQDSAEVDPDENVSGQAPPEATPDPNDPQSSQNAEAGSQTGQEQKTETDPDEDGAKGVDLQKGPGKTPPEQPHGQVDRGNARQGASDSTPADKEAGSAGQTLPKQTATPASPAPEYISGEDPGVGTNIAETNAEVLDVAIGQGTGDVGGRKRSDKRSDKADRAPRDHQQTQRQPSQVGAPLRAQRQGENAGPAKAQAGQRAGEPSAPYPAGAADEASAEAEARAIAAKPATSAGEPTSPVDDQKALAAEEAARPAATAAPESRMNVSLRIGAGQEPQAGSAQPPQEADESPQVDQARFVRRVARAFRAIGKRSGHVRLQLSPPQLGSLRVEITVRDGLMTARVEAETATARNLLLDNLPALRDRLAQQDIRVKQFDVGLMDRSPGGLPDQTANHTQSHHRGGGNAPPGSGEADRDANAVSGPGVVNRPGEEPQLNVVI